jgi:hypothetical protein
METVFFKKFQFINLATLSRELINVLADRDESGDTLPKNQFSVTVWPISSIL